MKIKELLKESMSKEQAEAIFAGLGVKQPLRYTQEQLKKLYIALVKKNHPDVGGNVKVAQDLNAAYDVLTKIKTGLDAAGFRSTPDYKAKQDAMNKFWYDAAQRAKKL